MNLPTILVLLVAILLVLLLCWLLYRATAGEKFTVGFFVAVMMASIALTIYGAVLLVSEDAIYNPNKRWEGVALTCFGLTHLTATMAACVLLRRRKKEEVERNSFRSKHEQPRSPLP